jgi:Protein of unknown function (DUF4242)
MPTFVVEREISGAGQWAGAEVRKPSRKSVAALRELGAEIQSVESYVIDDPVHCVYFAPSAELIRTDAAKGGFPENRTSEVLGSLGPTAAEG